MVTTANLDAVYHSHVAIKWDQSALLERAGTKNELQEYQMGGYLTTAGDYQVRI
eukprot:CAMPEP_0202696450 /NCGR_PEP_ID=MMETSP1385-20130828/9754_1 /ASSEMBLY_ACC=CAM_ASM_000861 /TAXON_ID=933848 /ORGANISM="Elphidium margaritaceum" /LENGTH=53 /DNA_ID=CAMNT_0049352627 /DNA_START=47 /DNA_END=209 /DNA_ORIENTATION=-